MRRSDKKANIAEANRLAEEAFMKEREMMGIPSPVKEEAPEAPEYNEDQVNPTLEGIIGSILKGETEGYIEEMDRNSCEILFQTSEINLVVYCDIEVDEYPYWEKDTNSGTNGGLILTITGGYIEADNLPEKVDLTVEQLKPLEKTVHDIMHKEDQSRQQPNLQRYFGDDEPDHSEDPDDYYDRSREDREFGGMDEEINEIKRITKRLLGE